VGRRVATTTRAASRRSPTGVLAIAITLLIIEIGVPHLEDEPPGTTLPQALIGLWSP
jgi:hypothetical protein